MDQLPGLLVLLATALAVLLALLTAMLVRGARRPPRHTAGWAIARGLPVDPDEMQLPFEAWSLERPDGAVLPVWEIRAPGAAAGPADPSERAAARGSPRPTAVLVHGWGQSRIDMLARLGPWRDLCERVVLYDLRGHGDAEGGLSRLGAGEERDLLALLERLGDGPFVLVGWSLGATIAINAVLRGGPAGRRVAGIVAYGPYLDFAVALRGKLRSLGYPTRPVTDLATAWLTLRGMRPPSLGATVAELPCPLLVIQGALDAISPADGAQRLAELAPRGALHFMPEAAHVDHHEDDEHDDLVRRFVSGLPAGA